MEKAIISAVMEDRTEARITLLGVPQRALAAAGVTLDMISTSEIPACGHT